MGALYECWTKCKVEQVRQVPASRCWDNSNKSQPSAMANTCRPYLTKRSLKHPGLQDSWTLCSRFVPKPEMPCLILSDLELRRVLLDWIVFWMWSQAAFKGVPTVSGCTAVNSWCLVPHSVWLSRCLIEGPCDPHHRSIKLHFCLQRLRPLWRRPSGEVRWAAPCGWTFRGLSQRSTTTAVTVAACVGLKILFLRAMLVSRLEPTAQMRSFWARWTTCLIAVN